jgi:hypothetical protein
MANGRSLGRPKTRWRVLFLLLLLLLCWRIEDLYFRLPCNLLPLPCRRGKHRRKLDILRLLDIRPRSEDQRT